MIPQLSKAALALLAATSGQPLQPHDTNVGELIAPMNATLLDSQDPFTPAIEVVAPPCANVKGEPCVVPLGEHTFGFSWGSPFVGTFPDSSCNPDEYPILYLKWEASCPLGVQFDRIAAVWINGLEMLRTSTQEPDRRTGVTWTVRKDISTYYDVVRAGGDVVIALDNIVDSTYNSSFSISLSAEFYAASDDLSAAKARLRPDTIVPVSKNTTTSYGWFLVEPSSTSEARNTAMVSVPRNTEELYLELFLSHHQCDEFYYGNPPSTYAEPLGWCGNGPFREVHVLVDDALVGVVWPFPLVFTGGFNPYLWRPIVGIGAFAAPTYLVPLTPFLDHFVDGEVHNMTFFVDHGLDYWPIDGNLLVYQDLAGTQTEVTALHREIERHVEPQQTQEVDGIDANFTFAATRDLRATTRVTTSRGSKVYDLRQRFEYANAMAIAKEGNDEVIDAQTTVKSTLRVTDEANGHSDGHDRGHTMVMVSHEEYPFHGRSYYQPLEDGAYRLEAEIDNGFRVASAVIPTRYADTLRYPFETGSVHITMHATAASQTAIGGNGSTEALFQSFSPHHGCLVRDAAAENGQLLKDDVDTNCLFDEPEMSLLDAQWELERE